jgi:hypothetical protein
MKLKVAAIVPWIALKGSHALDQAAKRLVVGDYNKAPQLKFQSYQYQKIVLKTLTCLKRIPTITKRVKKKRRLEG